MARRNALPVSLLVAFAVALGSPLSARAMGTPIITSVAFKGTPRSPAVVVNGMNFGNPPTAYSNGNTSCGTYTGNGSAYAGQLTFTDKTHPWSAGGGTPPNGNCIGLIVSEWSDSVVVFTFGEAYGSFDHWTADPGDQFLLLLKGERYTGTVSYRNNHFTILRVTPLADGVVDFSIKLPGPGRVDLLETAWNDNLARPAITLQPAPRRFVFARARMATKRAGTVRVKIKPGPKGALLVTHHRYRVTLRLWVSYTPTGGRYRSIGVYGVHLPNAIGQA